MPVWIINLLLPLAIKLVTKYGIPAVEAEWPKLTPILNEVIQALKTTEPSTNLQASAEHFNMLSTNDVFKSSVSPKVEMASMP